MFHPEFFLGIAKVLIKGPSSRFLLNRGGTNLERQQPVTVLIVDMVLQIPCAVGSELRSKNCAGIFKAISSRSLQLQQAVQTHRYPKLISLVMSG